MLKIRVGVLEQHNIACFGLCEHLSRQPALFLVGAYDTFDSTLQALQQQRLDVLMIGHLIDNNPRQLVRILSRRHPGLKVLVLLDYPDPQLASTLQSLGAQGVMSKTQPLPDYLDALQSLARGEHYAVGNDHPGCDPQAMLQNLLGSAV